MPGMLNAAQQFSAGVKVGVQTTDALTVDPRISFPNPLSITSCSGLK